MPVSLLQLIVPFLLAQSNASPTVRITADDAIIDESCRIVIPTEYVIADVNDNGVIQIGASDIEIEFAEGTVLRGATEGVRPDEYSGYGIRLNGHQNVTIRNARIGGYWCGLWATEADGLMLDGIDASDNRRARLNSTSAAEDAGDWLFPHENDNNEWLEHYGAAIYVEDSDDVTVRNCRVWHGQNGLCLDRVHDSKIYDNDFSLNSGWGIALWRSSRNVISRNACDFCVRGYSHGVYNRGQDSAGILMFEQCGENVIAENSATHGGDGFFGFAGKEALGEAGEHPPEWYRGRGSNRNVLVGNDFSYAPAHGIEMTFSFDNIFVGNRLVENAICGVWAGYAHDTLIAKNQIEANGEMGYGPERGGVNIEHGSSNRILDNTFERNWCGVHIWWDPDQRLAALPWAQANGTDSVHTLIAGNRFTGDQLAMQFRVVQDREDPAHGTNEVTVGDNEFRDVAEEIESDEASVVRRKPMMTVKPIEIPDYPVYGETRPVGARQHLRGRQNIIMTEWGPWDHESPLVRLVADTGDSMTYELRQFPGKPEAEIKRGTVQAWLMVPKSRDLPARYKIETTGPGVYPFAARVWSGEFERRLTGTLIDTTWHVTFFKWTPDVDPREKLEAWRALARGEGAVSADVKRLEFRYGHHGPSEQNLGEAIKAANLGGDHFGMFARTELPLSAGTWTFTTTSDDGVRVIVDGRPIIENWTWHGPTRDTGTLQLAADKTVEITVEHFEIDGYAELDCSISGGQ